MMVIEIKVPTPRGASSKPVVTTGYFMRFCRYGGISAMFANSSTPMTKMNSVATPKLRSFSKDRSTKLRALLRQCTQ